MLVLVQKKNISQNIYFYVHPKIYRLVKRWKVKEENKCYSKRGKEISLIIEDFQKAVVTL